MAGSPASVTELLNISNTDYNWISTTKHNDDAGGADDGDDDGYDDDSDDGDGEDCADDGDVGDNDNDNRNWISRVNIWSLVKTMTSDVFEVILRIKRLAVKM